MDKTNILLGTNGSQFFVTTVPTPHLDGKHVVFGEVINGKSIIRQIENLPTLSGDKPEKEATIVDCGELKGEDYKKATEKTVDATGDPYEDFPEDQGTDMEGTEVLKIATTLKEMGNKAFKSGDLSLGLAKYQKGLRYLHEYPEPTEKDPADLGKQLNAVKVVLHSNSALLQNKLKDFDGALKSASNAIEVSGATDADKGKAYYRRALARAGKKNEEEALKDLETAQKYAPGDSAIINELSAIKKRVSERRQKEKAAYSKFFQ